MKWRAGAIALFLLTGWAIAQINGGINGSSGGAGCTFEAPQASVGPTAVTGSTGDCLDAGSAPPLNEGANYTLTGGWTFNGTVAGTALSTYLASPPALGGTAAASGNFTTLGTSGLVTTALTAQTANTNVIGNWVNNSTPASTSNQQFACDEISGQGWKTTSVAASEEVDWMLCNTPQQGATVPTSILEFYYQAAGGGFGSAMSLASNGAGLGLLTVGNIAVNQTSVPSVGIYRPATNILGLAASVTVQSNAPLAIPSYTVSTLPTCSSSVNKYALAVVTDALTPTYNGTLVGSSSTIVPVFCNGTAWTSH